MEHYITSHYMEEVSVRVGCIFLLLAESSQNLGTEPYSSLSAFCSRRPIVHMPAAPFRLTGSHLVLT